MWTPIPLPINIVFFLSHFYCAVRILDPYKHTVERNRQALDIEFILDELGLEIKLNMSSPLNLTQPHGHFINSTWGLNKMTGVSMDKLRGSLPSPFCGTPKLHKEGKKNLLVQVQTHCIHTVTRTPPPSTL